MRAWIAAILVGLLSCAGPRTHAASARPVLATSPDGRLENLRRAAQYPWNDDGTCAAREAAGEWNTLVEQCYHALDLSRIQFRDVDHRCPVAQVNATTLQAAVGICLLVQPEFVVGAIIVIGVVVVASAIAAEIAKAEALERRRVRGPCICRCFGPWTPTGDPEEGNPDAGRRAYDAECRSECVYRGFLPSNYTCQ